MPFDKLQNRLFHYTSLSTALEFILPNRELLLNPLIRTNDPRENKNFVFSAKSWANLDNDDLKKNNKEISEILREDCKVLCFSIDHKDYFGYEYARMWSHYGGNHKGVCLELDKNVFIEENIDIIKSDQFKKVKYFKLEFKEIQNQQKQIDYTKIDEIGRDKYIKEHFRVENLDFLYFQKNEEWKSEREMRVIYFSNKRENEFCSIQKSLKKIHLGIDFSDSYLPSIRSNLKGSNIDICRLEYSGNVRLTSKKI